MSTAFTPSASASRRTPVAVTGSTSRPRMVEQAGVRVGLAHAALVVVVLVVDGLALSRADGLAAVSLVALVGATTVGVRGAALLGTSCWAFWTGFVEHREAQLTLAGHDLARLAVLVGGSLLVALAARALTRTAGGVSRG